MINGIGTILVYRQYLKLAAESMEFAALVVTSIQEREDGSVTVDPLALTATLDGSYQSVIRALEVGEIVRVYN